MKIGLVCPYNMSRGGAVQEIINDTSAELRSRGHTVKVITGRPKKLNGLDTTDIIFVGKVTDFRSPTHTLASFTTSDALETARVIAAEHFDILHLHEPGMPLLGQQMLEQATCATVATFHAKLPDTALSRAIGKAATPYLKAILENIDELVVGSSAAADYIHSLTDRPLHHISNGVNLKTFRPSVRKLPGSPKKILYVGRLEHRKGVRYLIQAYHLLSQYEPDVSLIVVGAGPSRSRLEALVKDGNIPNVTFLGLIDNTTKLRLLAEADLFCAPSIFGESFGLVLLEAMATGLVTVAGNNPGYASVMQGRGALSIVNPYDTSDFARRLSLLLTEEPLRELWRKWALDYVKQFDYVDIVTQYEAVYQRALKRHARVAGKHT